MIRIIENAAIKNRGIAKEIEKMTSKDTIVILSDNGEITISEDVLNVLRNSKTQIGIGVCKNNNDFSWIYTTLLASGQEIVYKDAALRPGVNEILNKYVSIRSNPLEALKAGKRKGSTSSDKSELVNEVKKTRKPRTVKSKMDDKEPDPDTEKSTVKEETISPISDKKKESPLLEFLKSCDDADFTVSKYYKEIYKACKLSITKKQKLCDCFVNTLPTEALAKEVCRILGQKASELSEAFKNECKCERGENNG